jgi:DNA-directed RNA polymerase specialized sigma24 family protein
MPEPGCLRLPGIWLLIKAASSVHHASPRWCIIPDNAPETVDSLAECLPRILDKMAESDRIILTLCDLEGMKQADFADRNGLTLAATKSRLSRAR